MFFFHSRVGKGIAQFDEAGLPIFSPQGFEFLAHNTLDNHVRYTIPSYDHPLKAVRNCAPLLKQYLINRTGHITNATPTFSLAVILTPSTLDQHSDHLSSNYGLQAQRSSFRKDRIYAR